MNLKYLLSSVMVCAAASVYAAGVSDLGEMTPGAVYDYEAFSPIMGYYTPVESGVMKAYSTGDEIGVFLDADHKNEIFSEKSFYTPTGEKARIYTVTQGQTLYFYHPGPISGGKFRFEVGSEEVKIGMVDPSPERVLSISNAYRAEIEFNISVKCTKCKLEINDESAELTPDVVDSYVTVNWFNTLRMWYRAGKISEGDVLTLTLSGIRDEFNSSNRPDFGDGPGKLVLKYKMAAAPAELVAESGTPGSGTFDFLSYYLPDGDDGLVSLSFSSELDPACHPIAEIQYGDQDNVEAGMYIENPPVLIDGNVLTVDLRGVMRTPEGMVPGLPAQKTIALIISQVKSADGQYVLTGQMASPYSFGYSYNFKTVAFSIAADWVPAAGSALAPGTEMEIWVLNGQQIAFDSVDFSYVKDGVPAVASVPYSDLRIEKDAYSSDALLYYLAAPVMTPDPDSEISVSFGGLVCADGLDHSSDIFVRYKSAGSGVDAVETVDADAPVFDLMGRRVLSPSKGIYISNGKKTIIK